MQVQHPSCLQQSSSPKLVEEQSAPFRAVVLTVAQFARRYPAFSEPALRNLIFKAATRDSSAGVISGNGLVEAGAIIRIGRKVLIHEARFFDWIDAQSTGLAPDSGRSKSQNIAATSAGTVWPVRHE